MQKQLTNGTWVEVKFAHAADYVALAVETEKWLAPCQQREPRMAEKIWIDLAEGQIVKIGLEWFANIRNPLPAPIILPDDYPDGRKLACGCIAYNSHEVMSASLGSSCEGCYDRMSA